MKNSNFVVFIISHERADNLATYRTLKKAGYTGEIKIVVDDEDEQLNEYQKLFGDELIVFSKLDMLKRCDTMDNFNIMTSALYARNFVFEYADAHNIEIFAMADDDVEGLYHRYSLDYKKMKKKPITNLDGVFIQFIELLKVKSIDAVAFANDGIYFGGTNGKFKEGYGRTINQFMMFKSSNLRFSGTRNEDMNICVRFGKVGSIFMELYNVCVDTPARSTNKGGLHSDYAVAGEYVANFYSLIAAPNCFALDMKKTGARLRRNNTAFVPLIIDERFKK